MNSVNEIKNPWKLIGLHLFPGIVLSMLYLFFLKIGILAEYPRIVILGFSMLFSSIPLELGYLIYTAKKETGTLNLFNILGFKSKLNLNVLIRYTIFLIIIGTILLVATKPLSNSLFHTVFHWIPRWYNFEQDLHMFRKHDIIIAVITSFFLMTLLGPIIEELYFRGFLLARMKWMGTYSVLINTVLFSVYHFYSPWLVITKIAIMLPLCYCVYRKDSLKLGIIVHCLAQSADVVYFITLLM